MPHGQPSGEDRLRADLYDYPGLVLARPMDRMVLDLTAGLTGDGPPLGQAISALAEAARAADPVAVRREYEALFLGLGRGRGELLPYASYCLTGFLNEKPQTFLRGDFARLRLARAAGVFEPEDGIASLMASMGAIIVGRFGSPVAMSRQRDFWARHVGLWAGYFFADLAGSKGGAGRKNSGVYAALGRVGAAFMDIECEAFRLAAA